MKFEVKNKIKWFVFLLGVTGVVLLVATYAWFVGITQVSVKDFEIKVNSSAGLLISLDGKNFSSSVSISDTKITDDLLEIYPTHTNHWAGSEGLVALSSVGKIDTTVSRLNIYSKTSLSNSIGGYKLRADLIDNHTITSNEVDNGDGTTSLEMQVSPEQDGYVVFDLFLKNVSGDVYLKDYSADADEPVYLMKNSIVKMVSGEGVETEETGDGIENSMRLAFMQIGRVEYNSALSDIQGISCISNGIVTGLCNVGPSEGRGYTWNIWEPNDTGHTADSVARFSKICKKRTDDNTYGGACDAISSGIATDSYCPISNVTAEDNVNIYDGLNDYNSTKLKKMDYYTDTIKNYDIDNRKEIFYLASNSITKMRVYVYIEGQDVDNYDLGTISKKVSVSFSFTKDRFYDLNEDGSGEEINNSVPSDDLNEDEDESSPEIEETP